jgi:FkbM family methyltransferase
MYMVRRAMLSSPEQPRGKSPRSANRKKYDQEDQGENPVTRTADIEVALSHFGNYPDGMKKLIHRILRSLGLHIEKHRDPYADMARIVPNVRVAIDGGAYRGDTTRRFLRDFPSARVIAFEANPDLAAALEKQFAGDPRVEIHNQALSNTAGPATFHIPKAAFTGSLLVPGEEFGDSRVIQVPAIELDALEVRPEILKLDLQGAELKAIQGAQATLPSVKALLCEVNFVARYDGCALFHEVATLLAGHGLKLFRLYEVHADRAGQWQFADALFVRS